MAYSVSWNEEKNAGLLRKYGFGYERVLVALQEDGFLDDRRHPNGERYKHQRQLLVRIEGYVYVIPYVLTENAIFFKTMFPSRKAAKQYLQHEQ